MYVCVCVCVRVCGVCVCVRVCVCVCVKVGGGRVSSPFEVRGLLTYSCGTEAD